MRNSENQNTMEAIFQTEIDSSIIITPFYIREETGLVPVLPYLMTENGLEPLNTELKE